MVKPVNKTLQIAAMSGGVELGHVSGPIASFRSNGDPLQSLLVNIDPVQDLHGYDNPWPAGGKGNVMPPNTTNETKSNNGITIKAENGVYTISGTATADFRITFPLLDGFTIPKSILRGGDGCAYFFNTASTGLNFAFMDGNTQIDTWGLVPANRTTSTYATMGGMHCDSIKFYGASGLSASLTVSPMITNDGTTDKTAFVLYQNICPISGWDGMTVYHSGADTSDPTTYPITWQSAGTVYGGTLDVLTGKLRVYPYYASYNGETLVGPWISSMDAYAPGTTPTIGAQVVDMGGVAAEYQLTARLISSLAGENNLWADTGDVDVTYVAVGGEGGKLALLLRNRKELLIAMRKGLSPAEVGLLGSIPSFGGSFSPGVLRPGLNTQEEVEDEKDDA